MANIDTGACMPGTALGLSQATSSVSISMHMEETGLSPVLREELYQRPQAPVHTWAHPPKWDCLTHRLCLQVAAPGR